MFLTKRALNNSSAGNPNSKPSKVSENSRFTFKKAERLSGKKTIDELFSEGKSFTVFPIRVFFIEKEFSGNFPAKILIGATRARLSKAVDRNKAKRLIREAYRRNKYLLYSVLKEKNKKLVLGFIYTGNEIMLYTNVEAKIIVTLNRLATLYDSR